MVWTHASRSTARMCSTFAPWAFVFGMVGCEESAAGTPVCAEGETLVEGEDGLECEPDSSVPDGEVDESQRFSPRCRSSPSLRPGRYSGSLFNADESEGGACGLGGPDAFIRVPIAARADLRATVFADGFVPRIELRGAACPGGIELACGLPAEDEAEDPNGGVAGISAEALDLPAGSEVMVAVGIDPEDPALDGGTLESLAFEVLVEVTLVLEEGEVCRPVERGRCVDGTTCSADTPDAPPVDWACQAVFGDACGGEIPTVSVGGDGVFSLEVSEGLGDVHSLTCDDDGQGGAEMVVALALSSSLPADALLRIASPGVRKAVRSPWCDVSAEVACVGPEAGPLEISQIGELAARGESPVLLLEWESGEDLPQTVELDLSLVTP